jgi:hypothetical protein
MPPSCLHATVLPACHHPANIMLPAVILLPSGFCLLTDTCRHPACCFPPYLLHTACCLTTDTMLLAAAFCLLPSTILPPTACLLSAIICCLLSSAACCHTAVRFQHTPFASVFVEDYTKYKLHSDLIDDYMPKLQHVLQH